MPVAGFGDGLRQNHQPLYRRKNRSVVGKDMGPLVSAEEMSRCIHCTRCVRFTEEIAGVQEIAMANRGEHSEIMPFIGKAVETELSGNVIDFVSCRRIDQQTVPLQRAYLGIEPPQIRFRP